MLELPETDRLYGELAKLHEMARQPLDEAAREQRVEQAHRVWTLRPGSCWKITASTLRKVEPRQQTASGFNGKLGFAPPRRRNSMSVLNSPTQDRPLDLADLLRELVARGGSPEAAPSNA